MKNLTQEELKILRYMSRGISNPEMGKLLYKSVHTVKMNVSSILKKLNAKTRTEAVFLACQDKEIFAYLLQLDCVPSTHIIC